MIAFQQTCDYGSSSEGSRAGAHPIKYPVLTSRDYSQILLNELSISVRSPRSQPFQLSNHFYVTLCTTVYGAKAKTNVYEKHVQCTSAAAPNTRNMVLFCSTGNHTKRFFCVATGQGWSVQISTDHFWCRRFIWLNNDNWIIPYLYFIL